MKQYKYYLDKSSKKFICPKCQKRTLVKYCDIETQGYLSDEYGRCDRETNCRYHNTPKGLICGSFEIKEVRQSYHDSNLVKNSCRNYQSNNFMRFLATIFSIDEVIEVASKYFIGTSKFWDGATIFWQIDDEQNVRHGKVMLFNQNTGKRMKSEDGKAYINSVRSLLKLKDFNIKQCLFGLHLVDKKHKKTIAIVESEKTAIIMSLFKPELVWLATGMKSGFNFKLLKPIINYNIIAFPDKSEYGDWLNKAIELNKIGFKIIVNEWLEHTDFEKGTDFADVYINSIIE
jgi:hypothetical protein